MSETEGPVRETLHEVTPMSKEVPASPTMGLRAAAAALSVLAVPALLLAASAPAAAQSTGQPTGSREVGAGATVAERPLATRAQLEAQLEALESRSGAAPAVQAQIEKIRTRLREGDFRAGDLVDLRVRGDADLTGSFSVNENRALEAGNLPPLSLDGVLYSEVEPALQEAISQYVRDPYVRARVLMRIAVVGGVGRPGFYDLPPTATLSEALMEAGGPASRAKLDEIEYLRRGNDLLDERKGAMDRPVETLTLAELGARRGDQLRVPPGDGKGSFMTVVGVVSGLSGIAWGISRVF